MSFLSHFFPRWLRQRLVLGRIKKLLQKLGLPEGAIVGFMTGWKTWAGGLSLIGAGIATIFATVSSGEFNMDEIAKGLGMLGAGLSAIGLGHKIEKAVNGTK